MLLAWTFWICLQNDLPHEEKVHRTPREWLVASGLRQYANCTASGAIIELRVSAPLPSPGTPHFIWWLREACSIGDECARSQAPTLLLSGQSKQHGLELVIRVFLRWPLHVVASRKVCHIL